MVDTKISEKAHRKMTGSPALRLYIRTCLNVYDL